MTPITPFGWWKRPRPQSGDPTPHTAPSARGGRPFPRWDRLVPFGRRLAVPDDPLLRLAADWLQLQGGALQATSADGFSGSLADGSGVAYTRSVPRAQADEQVTLLAPGAPGLQAIVEDIARQTTHSHLTLDAPTQGADAIARAALAPPSADCTSCIEPGSPRAGQACGPHCPLAQGRYVIVGSERGIRDARIEERTWSVQVDYAFQLSVSSSHQRDEEVLRICLDAQTGRELAPLPTTVLATATATPNTQTNAPQDMVLTTTATADARVARAAYAASRLARLQALAAYRQRQEHITRTYNRLLLEAPERAHELLAARTRELERCAEAATVECEVRPLAVATLRVPGVRVRVRLVGGGEVVTEVDTLRQQARAPHCSACDAEWRVGARCAAGHVTCVACSQTCAHCGARRCALCATPGFSSCPTCDALACPRCVAAAARGKHRAPREPGTSSAAHGADPSAAPASGPEHEPEDADDLTLADLAAMSDRTWHRFVTWLLAQTGFDHERDLGVGEQAGTSRAMYRRGSQASATPSTAVLPPMASAGPSLAVLAYRPPASEGSVTQDAGDAWLPSSLLAQAERDAAALAGATPVVVATARASLRASLPSRPGGAKSPIVLDRDSLAAALVDLRAAFERQQALRADAQERRAEAAEEVRAMLIAGLQAAAECLRGESPSASGTAASDAGADGGLSARVAVVRQALAAIETLIGEWEGTFGPTAARDGSLPLLAEVETYAQQQALAHHLMEVLAAAAAALAAAAPASDRALTAWWEAVREETGLRAEALAGRTAALDPRAWPSFERAHDTTAAVRSADVLAAAGRAGLRARRLQDELDAREARPAPPAGDAAGQVTGQHVRQRS